MKSAVLSFTALLSVLLATATNAQTNETEPVGASYCTFAPDFECYPEYGIPACCSDDNDIVCPEEQPGCEEAPGASYCTFAPDFDCYEGGWPACCGTDDCPEEKPECNILAVGENATSTGVDGGDDEDTISTPSEAPTDSKDFSGASKSLVLVSSSLLAGAIAFFMI